MHELHRWMNDQFDQRLVEPNSAVGQALQSHVDEVKVTPALWLPWNYREQLAHTG